jgi:hypothetical protein
VVITAGVLFSVTSYLSLSPEPYSILSCRM